MCIPSAPDDILRIYEVNRSVRETLFLTLLLLSFSFSQAEGIQTSRFSKMLSFFPPRDDCPEYCVFANGVLVKKVPSLSSYTPQLQDMVTFYLGCSFGFENALKAAGVPVRNVEQGKNVSMYKVSRIPRAGFKCSVTTPLDLDCVRFSPSKQ